MGFEMFNNFFTKGKENKEEGEKNSLPPKEEMERRAVEQGTAGTPATFEIDDQPKTREEASAMGVDLDAEPAYEQKTGLDDDTAFSSTDHPSKRPETGTERAPGEY